MDDVQAVVQKLNRHDFEWCAILVVAEEQHALERPVRWLRWMTKGKPQCSTTYLMRGLLMPCLAAEAAHLYRR